MQLLMKKNFGFLGLGLLMAASAIADSSLPSFPSGPDAQETPGSLCTTGNTRRYPEHIPYCNRAVGKDRKMTIFANYIALGYKIDMARRKDFKIDHLIPLCAGGSNEDTNLWPQHMTIYAITDPLEPAICGKMGKGVLKQADAVQLILRAKHNLSEVPAILSQIEAL